MVKEFDDNSGYGDSVGMEFTIANTETGALLAPVDLGRLYAFIVVRCTSVANVADPANTVSFHLGLTDNDAMLPFKDENGLVTHILDDIFHRVYFVGAAQRVRCILSAAATGDVTFAIYGVDAAMNA